MADGAGTVCSVGGRPGRGWGEDCVGISSIPGGKREGADGVMLACDSPRGGYLVFIRVDLQRYSEIVTTEVPYIVSHCLPDA